MAIYGYQENGKRDKLLFSNPLNYFMITHDLVKSIHNYS